MRNFIERTQIRFLCSPIGKGVMTDERPLAVSAARTLALQNADVVFLMGARFNWILHPSFRGGRLRPAAALRQGRQVKVIQLDIAPEEIGHNRPTDVALVGPRVWPKARPRTGSGKAIMIPAGPAGAGEQQA